MKRTCQSCGVEAHTGARFCRWCGIRLWDGGSDDGTNEVSPQATTVPLSDDVRETDGLAQGDDPCASADTTRVSREELERLLRAQSGAGAKDENAAHRARPRSDSFPPTGHARTHDETHAELEPTLLMNSTGEIERTGEVEPTGELERTGERPPPPPDFDGRSGEDELTVTVPRRVVPLDTGRVGPESAGEREPHRPARPTGEGVATPPHAPRVSTSELPTSSHAPHAPHEKPPSRRRRWPVVVALSLSFLLLTVAASWFTVRYLIGRQSNGGSTQAPVAPAPVDAKQLFEEKLAEAEAMLAQGKLDDAVRALREAAEIDPNNTRAHRRLGEILLDSGARREAIEQFRALTRNAPEDFTAWRQLAAAEFAEGLHRESAESYRRLIALVGESAADPHDLLSYADALRLSGRTGEARVVYRRLSNVPFAEIARVADQRLAKLEETEPTPTPSPRAVANGEAASSRGVGSPAQPPSSSSPAAQPAPRATAEPAPTPRVASSSSPADQYRRGVELWASDRQAALAQFREAARGGVADAHYYLGLSYVQGRNLSTLKRAEIVAALRHFQFAQRGQHAEQSRRYARQLEQEYDRIRR